MSEFSIRSIEFSNANTVPVVSAARANLIGVDNTRGEFVKVPIDNIITDKIGTGNVASSGLTMTLNTVDGKYHIGKDYTNTELEKLNVIDICLNRMTNTACNMSMCSGYCIAVTTSITSSTCTASSCVANCGATCGVSCVSDCMDSGASSSHDSTPSSCTGQSCSVGCTSTAASETYSS